MLSKNAFQTQRRFGLSLMNSYNSMPLDFKSPFKGPFCLGKLLITRNARTHLEAGEAFFAIQRHRMGDWGDVSESAWARNQRAVQRGGRIKSSYKSLKKKTFWVITDADRSVTTILMPQDN